MKRWGPLQLTTHKTLIFDLLPQCIINGPKVNGYNFSTSEPILLIVHENDRF